MTVCFTMLNKCNKCSMYQNKYNLINQNQRLFSIVLPDENTLEIPLEIKSSVGDLFQKVCNKLQLKEFDIFGLALKIKNENHFLNNDEKIRKFLKQTTVSTNGSIFSQGSSPSSLQTNDLHCELLSYSSTSISNKSSFENNYICSCSPPEPTIQLYFCVKFYVTDPLLLRDYQTRHFYYLQLRNNYLSIKHKLSDEKYFTLASLALVVDFGTFNKKIHSNKYFNLKLYFPDWMINKLGENFIYENVTRLHEQESRYSSTNAQTKFCIELSNDDYPFNFQLYSVYKNKDEMTGSICLGIAPKGILVFELRDQGEISLITTFNWSTVTKLNSEKKKFEVLINIDSKLRKYTYYTNCEKFSKYLLDLSKITHAFTVNTFARLVNQKTLANYVSESCAGQVLEYNENHQEKFEEREIRENDKEEELPVIKPDCLSMSSLSTSSSSNFETALCLNNSNEYENFGSFTFVGTLIQDASPVNELKSLKKRVDSISNSICTDTPHNGQISNCSEQAQAYTFQSQQKNNSLNYRQTFSAQTESSQLKQGSFRLTSNRGYLPPPPPLPFIPQQNQTYFSQMINPKPNDYLSDSSVDDVYHMYKINESSVSIRNEFQYNLYNYKMNDFDSTRLGSSPSFTPAYIKYKKPPSYEESIRKIKKHSISSSSSSSTYNDETESSKSSFRNDVNRYEKRDEVLYENVESSNQSNQSNRNTVELSIENLEEIRMKAASMSLPLLTALCSDQSIIRSLSKNKREGSF